MFYRYQLVKFLIRNKEWDPNPDQIVLDPPHWLLAGTAYLEKLWGCAWAPGWRTWRPASSWPAHGPASHQSTASTSPHRSEHSRLYK